MAQVASKGRMDRLLGLLDRHRHGIVGTLLVHTLLMYYLMLWHIPTERPPEDRNEIRVEIIPTELAEELEELLADDGAAPAGEVRSVTGNIAAEVEDRSIAPATERRLAQQVEQDLRELERTEFDRLAEERRERGEEIVMPELDPSKWDKELYMDKAVEPAREEGDIAVWHDLKDPLRAEREIRIPSYKCKGFGQVVVRVTVDRDGRVRNAYIDPDRTRTNDPCTMEEALRSATNATFHRHPDAPDRQPGAIYYRFMPQ
jgi:hypothetical protein